MNYKSFNLGDWIGHISGVIEDEATLDGNEMRDLVEFLSGLPKWIPVSERLPEERDTYYVTLKGVGELEGEIDDEVAFATYMGTGKTGWIYHDVDDSACKEITAWMPLPESYKAESEG